MNHRFLSTLTRQFSVTTRFLQTPRQCSVNGSVMKVQGKISDNVAYISKRLNHSNQNQLINKHQSSAATSSNINDQKHSTSHDLHLMKMWFHGGASEVILFKWWKVESYTGLFFSCIVIVAMGVAYEGLKWFRVNLSNIQTAKERQLADQSKFAFSKNQTEIKVDGSSTLPLDADDQPIETQKKPCAKKCRAKKFLGYFNISPKLFCSLLQTLQPALYVVQILLAYFLMLIAMTYNSYLTAAVVLGCGLGHWIFALSKYFRTTNCSSDNAFATDVCH